MNTNITMSEKATKDASLGNGYWFFFNYQNHEIVVYCSAISGREIVYVDEQEVSNKRSLRMNTVHEFAVDGNQLRIDITLKSLLGTEVRCMLLEGDKLLGDEKKSIAFTIAGKKLVGKKLLLWFFVIGFVSGFIGSYIAKHL